MLHSVHVNNGDQRGPGNREAASGAARPAGLRRASKRLRIRLERLDDRLLDELTERGPRPRSMGSRQPALT